MSLLNTGQMLAHRLLRCADIIPELVRRAILAREAVIFSASATAEDSTDVTDREKKERGPGATKTTALCKATMQ